MTLVEDIQTDYMKEDIPDFQVGDTIQVDVIISEGGAKRTQQFEGYVTARKGDGLDETFTVRKMVQGEGVERVFPLHSPKVDSIEKVRSGRVRRSKLYYLSEQKGKAAEIREDRDEEDVEEESESTDVDDHKETGEEVEAATDAEEEEEKSENEEEVAAEDESEEAESETAEDDKSEENGEEETDQENVQDEEKQE